MHIKNILFISHEMQIVVMLYTMCTTLRVFTILSENANKEALSNNYKR